MAGCGFDSASEGLLGLSILGERRRERPLGSLPVEDRQEGGSLGIRRGKGNDGTERTVARKPATGVKRPQSQAETVLEEGGGVGAEEEADLLRADRYDVLLRNDQCDILCELIDGCCARLET